MLNRTSNGKIILPNTLLSLADVSGNARIKQYPSSTVLQVANDPIFRVAGCEPQKRPYPVPSKGNGCDHERALQVSRARARASIRDIALCNDFTHFFTWTLDPNLIDRYDSAIVGKKVQTFLKNASFRKGLSYVCVGENHQDGAIHFHGLCKLGSVRIERAIDYRTGLPISTNRGQPVFNMVDWTLGFSTCIPIDENYERTCNYLTKYLTKDSQKIFGKWYYSSRDLIKRPTIEVLDQSIDFYSFVEDNPQLPVVPLYRDVRMAIMQVDRTSEVIQ